MDLLGRGGERKRATPRPDRARLAARAEALDRADPGHHKAASSRRKYRGRRRRAHTGRSAGTSIVPFQRSRCRGLAIRNSWSERTGRVRGKQRHAGRHPRVGSDGREARNDLCARRARGRLQLRARAAKKLQAARAGRRWERPAGTPREAAREARTSSCWRCTGPGSWNAREAGRHLSGKVVVSCSLPMNAIEHRPRDRPHVLRRGSAGREGPRRRVVAAFNTVPSEVLSGSSRPARAASAVAGLLRRCRRANAAPPG